MPDNARRRTRTELEPKILPSQQRSQATFNAILAASGEVLAEAGLDGFSTNAVCRRAGLTPPALYRYFPNKYALLKAVGEQLMASQDRCVLRWLTADEGLVTDGTALAAALYEMLSEVVQATARFKGSATILRAMRTEPILRDVRQSSIGFLVKQAVAQLRELHPTAPPAEIQRVARVSVEAGTAMVELAIEETCADADELLRGAATMIAHYQATLRQTP